MHQSEEPYTGPAGREAVPPGRPRLAARRAAPVLVVVLGLVSLILMTAVLAGGTAPPGSSGTRTQPDGAPVLQSVPTTTPTTTPATAPTEPARPSSESATAAPRSITPPTAAPSPATTTVPTTAAPAPTSADSDSDCGGQPTVSVDGQQWQCTFDDEFNGTALDTSNWAVQQTADGGYHSGMECFEDSPSNVSVSGGTLNLTAEQMPSSFLCPGDPPYYTQYTSGMVSTDQLFDQTDGLFEVRAKISGADDAGTADLLLALSGPVDLRPVAGVRRDRHRGALQPVPDAGHPVRALQQLGQRPRGHERRLRDR